MTATFTLAMLSPRVVPASEPPERTHNARGFLIIGPQCVNPSDVLAKLIADTHCPITAADPREQRRAMRLYSARHAQKMRELRAS